MSSSPPEPSFGQTPFGTARQGDQRRTRSLIDMADRLACPPAAPRPTSAPIPTPSNAATP